MLQHSLEPITREELSRLKQGWRPWVSKNLVDDVDENQNKLQSFVDVYNVTVEECFIPHNFNEECPLYLLDSQGMILILFGQWMFDPNTLIVPDDVFDKWDCNHTFFERFTLRGLIERGIVLKFTVEQADFVEAHKLMPGVKFKKLQEFQIIKGGGVTLMADLQSNGIIEI